MKRRNFVQSTLAVGVTTSPLSELIANEVTLAKTPRDYEGPYYPVGSRNQTANLVLGEPREKVLRFHGKVVDVNGHPYRGALVDIWQTDTLGRYRHPRDRSAGERWNDFLYWGESPINDDGEFEFRTYVPGAYGARPAHIHFKVWRNKRSILTSQIYFEERGGAQGMSKSPRFQGQQTVRLIEHGQQFEAFYKIVV